ncbi:hypothetical protein B0H66DRAFT_630699 [Apodospora peruviana]|uniref:Fe2OG dioxygenase domain-containing protein n=1 Tax=Apodospora peruviana TaxID=516989 RepID=A0AAE0HWI8_9PEZI|nr:hypothetical protein B0H66DRAFT_630699 [Apodospora peruviana]
MTQPQLSPLANLQTIDFDKLVNKDADEVRRLVEICTNDGFLYLDLTQWNGGKLLKSLDECNNIVKDWFTKPIEEKAATVTLSDAHGYKPVGQQSGVQEGQRDGYESLRLSRDCQLARDPLPPVVQNHQSTFDALHFGSHFVLQTILSALSDATTDPKNAATSFSSSHKDDSPSRSALYFLHHPPKPAGAGRLGQNIHTDAGTLTLLFTREPGLQVLSPTTAQWEHVASRPGCAVVNVGDTLRFLSGERFRSALHRVMPITDPVTGAQPNDRYSTAYFLRAADDAVFVGNDGKETTADEWFLRKFSSFTKDRSVQRLDSVAFGGMEKTLGVVV